MIKKILNRNNLSYPLMRDPKRNPKCYELTDQEREEAVQRVDRILRERAVKQTQRHQGT